MTKLKLISIYIVSFVLVCMVTLMAFAYRLDNIAVAQTRDYGSYKNVLVIVTDHELSYQHGTDNDTYGILRPNYDEFVDSGVEFVNAKSVNPLCSPARRSLLTALYPHQHGIIHNSVNVPVYANADTIYDVLLENGFDRQNAYFYGKTHYSGSSMDNDTPQYSYGINGWSTPGYGQPYKTQKYKDYLARNNYFGSEYTSPVMIIQQDSLSPNGRPAKGDVYDVANMNIITGNFFGIMQAPKEFHEAYFLADMVNTELENIAENNSDQPFVMSVNIWGPHHPYYPTQEFVDLYTDENGVIGGNIEEYPSFNDPFINKPKVYAWDNSVQNGTNPALPVPNSKDWNTFRTYMGLAYAQATMVDDAVGTILDTLEQTGLADDTLVIWTNDHGDALGSHGGHADKECYMTEEILDIQLAVRDPSRPDLAGTKNTSFVNTNDVPVTMLDAFDLSFDYEVPGMSLLDLMYGQASPREYMVCTTNGHFSDTRARTVYFGDYKYTYYANDIDELYNLKEDPFEMNNLIFEKDKQGIIGLMKTMLCNWQIEQRDNIPLINV